MSEENAKRKVYKNKINQDRGMSQKEAKEDSGYIFYDCKRSKLYLKREEYTVYETVLTTPYRVFDFPMLKIPELVFSDVEQGQFPTELNIKFINNIDSLTNFTYLEHLLEENLDEEKVLNRFRERNFPIHFEVQAHREFFKIKFLTFNPTV